MGQNVAGQPVTYWGQNVIGAKCCRGSLSYKGQPVAGQDVLAKWGKMSQEGQNVAGQTV